MSALTPSQRRHLRELSCHLGSLSLIDPGVRLHGNTIKALIRLGYAVHEGTSLFITPTGRAALNTAEATS